MITYGSKVVNIERWSQMDTGISLPMIAGNGTRYKRVSLGVTKFRNVGCFPVALVPNKIQKVRISQLSFFYSDLVPSGCKTHVWNDNCPYEMVLFRKMAMTVCSTVTPCLWTTSLSGPSLVASI